MDCGSRPGSRCRYIKALGMRRVWRGGFSLPVRSSESKMPEGAAKRAVKTLITKRPLCTGLRSPLPPMAGGMGPPID
eukprot:11363805-Alexandrium_andersonii.AAC.1